MTISWKVETMDSHAQIVADAIGSVRAEGLEPGSTVMEILDRWVKGTIETEQLGEAAQRIASGDSVAHLLSPPEPAAARIDRERSRFA
jgi:Antitoxin VbhA